jgi:glycosyltransferase involved in cell wall biosynthesis
MIFIFDSHPVQYKAPVYQRLQQLRPDSFKVFYASDFSVRGQHDPDFNTVVAWDTPLLEGYPHAVLGNERGTPLAGFRSLTGHGIYRLLQRERPDAVIISQFLYEYDLVTYVSSLLLGIPIWIRQETQDEAFRRPAWKKWLRHLLYRIAYRRVDHALYFGQLNREHLLRHGVPASKMSLAPFCTPEPAGVGITERLAWRESIRKRFQVQPDQTLLLFAGKLIEKKNPHLILRALRLLPDQDRSRFQLIFLGSGPLETSLRFEAAAFPNQVHFTGFINQKEIPQFYAAADILLLPSRRAGETWGLVVNEALQAGCAVIMTQAVGCHREFGGWERVRVIPEDDAPACAESIQILAQFPRSFTWCAETTAQAFACQIDSHLPPARLAAPCAS